MPRTAKKKETVVATPAKLPQIDLKNLTPLQKKHTALVIGALVIVALAFLVKTYLLVAIVNGQPITRMAVISELERQSGKKALDSLITKKIIEQEAAKKNIVVTAKEVDEEIKKIEKSLSGQGSKLSDALAQQGMTVEALQSELVFRKKLEKLVGNSEKVTDKEIDEFIKTSGSAMGEEPPTQEMRTQIAEKLKQDKVGQKIEKWINDHEKSSKIIFLRNY